MKRKKVIRNLFYAALNSLVMLFITFFWLYQPYILGNEGFLIKWTILVKKNIFGIDPKPNPEEVLFVDISQNKALLPALNQFGEESAYNRKVITDRSQLTQLIEAVLPYKEEIDFLLLDVLLEDPTPFDSLLEERVEAMGNKILGVSHLEDGERLVKPIISMPYGLATYTAANDFFVKYPLMLGDSLKTVPIVLLEKTAGKHLRKRNNIYLIDGKWNFPSVFLDFRIRPADFKTGSAVKESNFTIFDLGTVLETMEFMEEADHAAFFKGKKILVGDFVNDIHETAIGDMPGTLVLFNAFLKLQADRNRVFWTWILFLFLGFLFLSYRVIAEIQLSSVKLLSKLFSSKMWRLFLTTLDEAFILALLTILSFFLFGLHINVFMLFTYILLFQGMQNIWAVYQQRKREHQLNATQQ